MNRDKLRPVGTEFNSILYPGLNTTDQRATLYRYRVIRHTKVSRFIGDTEGTWAESVELLWSKKSKNQHDTFPFVKDYMITDWGLAVALGLVKPPEFD
jgi:hypothetical protein